MRVDDYDADCLENDRTESVTAHTDAAYEPLPIWVVLHADVHRVEVDTSIEERGHRVEHHEQSKRVEKYRKLQR